MCKRMDKAEHHPGCTNPVTSLPFSAKDRMLIYTEKLKTDKQTNAELFSLSLSLSRDVHHERRFHRQ
jgi:hypothetical protein